MDEGNVGDGGTRTRQDLAAQIYEAMLVRGYSKRALAKAAGINTRTLDVILAGQPGRPSKLRAVLNVLELDPLRASVPTPARSAAHSPGWGTAGEAIVHAWLADLPIDQHADAVAYLRAKIADFDPARRADL